MIIIHSILAIYKPTSLWAEYSKLKATIQKNYNNIDISYPGLRSFLRTISSGYHPQKCNFFQPDEIRRFFSEAEDNEFLAVKVGDSSCDSLDI